MQDKFEQKVFNCFNSESDDFLPKIQLNKIIKCFEEELKIKMKIIDNENDNFDNFLKSLSTKKNFRFIVFNSKYEWMIFPLNYKPKKITEYFDIVSRQICLFVIDKASVILVIYDDIKDNEIIYSFWINRLYGKDFNKISDCYYIYRKRKYLLLHGKYLNEPILSLWTNYI